MKGFLIKDRLDDTRAVMFFKQMFRFIIWKVVALCMVIDKSYPWLAFGSVSYLRKVLNSSMAGYEWGSGRSTMFFSRHVKSLVSVEHDRRWYEKVSQWIKKYGLKNITYHHIPAHGDSKGFAGKRPACWKHTAYISGKPQLADYFDHILQYPNSMYDFVLVDGKARVECVLNSMDKIKPGGLLIFDNSEREEYSQVFGLLKGWDRKDFTNGIWQTSIFFKPVRVNSGPGFENGKSHFIKGQFGE